MGILIEIGGFLGGVLTEYSRQKKWSKLKTFIIVSFSFFLVGLCYVFLVPPAKGKLFGLFIFAVAGISVGLMVVLLILLAKWCEDKKSCNHE